MTNDEIKPTEKDRETARETVQDWHDSDEARCGQCQSPFSHEGLYDRIAQALAEQREADAKKALAAKLPKGYQWGRDAMESFNYGKERAAAAIRTDPSTSEGVVKQ